MVGFVGDVLEPLSTQDKLATYSRGEMILQNPTEDLLTTKKPFKSIPDPLNSQFLGNRVGSQNF